MSYRRKHIKTKIYKLRKPKKSILKRPIFWISFLFLIIVLSFLYIFVFSSIFQVKNIEVSGNEKIQNKDIQDFAFVRTGQKIISMGSWHLESGSIFLVNYKKINKEILNNFSVIESVKISKKLPQTLTIEIIERKPLGAFCGSSVAVSETNSPPAKEECFLIDQNGIIFESLSEISDNMIIVRKPLDIKQMFTGEKVVAENIMGIISKIERNLKDNLQINIEEAIISNPLRLDIKTNENWQIYFDLDSDVDMQITKMNLLLNNEISTDARKNLKYVDLRFKDKAYYK
ncbi:MAG: FtsQ-type POTRA domain-containing protein [bacterium]|nr:FtsQ-type POTRA domain-containing protein [bacterium]